MFCSDLRVFIRSQGEEKITSNFKAKEFFCKCGKCHNQFIDIAHVYRIQLLRGILGKAITITSAYRCEAHNKDVGGSQDSQHCKGKATDIVISGTDPKDIIEKATQLGFGGIGEYSSFVHLDNREKKTQWKG